MTAASRPVPLLFAQGAGDMHHPEGSIHLVRYLERELRGACEIRAPEMPDAETNPQYRPWRDRILEELAAIDDEVLFVGHSLGGSVLLKMLAEVELAARVRGLFLASVPWWGPEGWDHGPWAVPADVATKLRGVPAFLYHSVDDPEVPVDHLARYAAILPDATVRRIPGAQHSFLEGVPELVTDIRATLDT